MTNVEEGRNIEAFDLGIIGFLRLEEGERRRTGTIIRRVIVSTISEPSCS